MINYFSVAIFVVFMSVLFSIAWEWMMRLKSYWDTRRSINKFRRFRGCLK